MQPRPKSHSPHIPVMQHIMPWIVLRTSKRCMYKKTIYPELLRARRCRLVVFGIETVGIGVRKPRHSVDFSHKRAQPAPLPPCAALLRALGCTAGVASTRLPRSESSPLRFVSFLPPLSAAGDPLALHKLLLADARWLQAPASNRVPARTT